MTLIRMFAGRRRSGTRGQVMIEMAISFVAFVMLTYVVLKVWTWLTTNVMQRQAAFQTTRILAAQEDPTDVPGRPVNFRPVPIQIVGAPGATSPGGGGIPYPPPPGGCLNDPRVLAGQLTAQADARMANYNNLQAQANLLDQLMILGEQIRQLQDQITVLQADIVTTQNAIAQTQTDLADAQAQAAPLQGQIDAANADINTWQGEIDAFLLGPPPGDPADPYVTDRQGWIATAQNDINNWQNALDAFNAQIAALQTQLANQQAQLAAQQAQLLVLQAQLLALQNQFDALVAGAGFAVDLSDPPNSLIAQRDAILAQAQAELTAANDLYNQARELMAVGIPLCQ